MRAPDAAALDCQDRRMTYFELDAAASRLARHMSARGIAPRTKVAVCLGRSMELPIAVLAILKVGATFVPLDPADPPGRRAALLQASNALAVVVEHGSPSWVAEQGVKIVEVSEALAGEAPAGDAHAEGFSPTEPVEADAAACLICPFGEAAFHTLSHRNLSNLIYSIAKRPGMNDRDVMVATSPPGLDRATAEILLPLLTGARLVLAPDEDLADGRRLLHLLQRTGATVVHASAACLGQAG